MSSSERQAKSRAFARLRHRIAAVGVALCLSTGLKASPESSAHFVIDAPQLSPALIQFSRQSGLSIVFPDHLARNIESRPIQGTLSSAEVLDRLLEDTDLDWELIESRIIAVYSKDCESSRDCASAADTISRYPVYVPGLEETYVYGSQMTGSRIRRPGYESAAPVDVLSAPEIELSGAQTLGELLKFVPAVAGNSLSTAISNGGDGTASVTLRGLPASNTLVLINGRRVANDGLAGESVDLNSIPPAAVERIEILKDGASAIYGSDAIAGVVNVIMKRDFYGLLAETFYGQTQEGDLDTQTHTLQYGTGFNRGSLFITGSYYKQDPIFSRDRRVSRSADTRDRGGADQRSSATPNARVVLPDRSAVIAEGQGYRPIGSNDLFDFADFTTAVVPLERSSLFANGSFDFSDQVVAFFDMSFVDTSANATLAPTPVFTGFEQTPLVVSADNRFNPFGSDLTDVRRRLVEFPDRRQRNESTTTRVGLTLEGLAADWNWDLSVNWSRSEATETLSNIVNADRLRRALGPDADCQGADVDGCVPVDLLGPAGSIDAAQVDFLRVSGDVSGYTRLTSFSSNVSRSLFELPGGRSDIAVGFEHRLEATSKRPDALLASTGTIGGTNFEATRGDRRISELYAETILPLWKSTTGYSSLSVEAALRFSDYSDFGDNTAPKLGARLQLGPSVLLRSTYAEGFRAPSLNELYEGASESQAFIDDPCTRPENVGTLPGCSAVADSSRNQFLTVTGGNPELEAETSESFSAGFLWTPGIITGLSLSADYFNIDQDNVVSSSAQFVVNQNARFGRFEENVIRDENGNLTLVQATNVNVGQRKVKGVDLAFNYQAPGRSWGKLSLSGSATYLDEYLARLDASSGAVDLAGTFGDEASEGLGGIPRWKGQVGARWERERWQASWEIHFVSDMREIVPGTERHRTIDNWMVHDLQLGYTFDVLEGLRWSVGVDNVLDEAAPLAASGFNDNIDGRTHELKGRYWYTKLSQRF
ncbi:TonB-dependent receptor [Parahalioglobus pacificus]|uniref:TonB-dependent receptor n=1 Tax=Parahalioglobus pacificus TaxID=930806 RepID=A0A919CM66_9GAMM|nr:TonB-dependent receptor [Halioglobus pacificus]GHD35274.1 TonB-dependent receptor [Halioglobus pacificus]